MLIIILIPVVQVASVLVINKQKSLGLGQTWKEKEVRNAVIEKVHERMERSRWNSDSNFAVTHSSTEKNRSSFHYLQYFYLDVSKTKRKAKKPLPLGTHKTTGTAYFLIINAASTAFKLQLKYTVIKTIRFNINQIAAFKNGLII